MDLFNWLWKKLTGASDQPARGTPKAVSPPSTTERGPPRPQSLGLDAGDFLPISRAELKAGAQGTSLWGNPWFGRRDLIPPADDARTKLIDRGLVTHGLLTPEQLVEMHEVGAEMERLRPTLVAIATQAAQAGEAAVQADRQRRAALKEQKKQESQERKRRRAEAIAHRRATDILFLGRGVSGRLGERQSDAAKLADRGLPVLSTPAEVAAALGLSIPRLRWLAFHTEFLPGRSTVTNAQPHAGKAVVLNMDLENFFPSIAFPRVRSVFRRLGYSPAVATILSLLCTECPRRLVAYDGKPYWVATGPRSLPQGACTSPALSNQVARRLDKRLAGLAAKLSVTYSRYADDLTFAGAGALESLLGYLMARVRHLAGAEGFAVNQKKTRVLRRHTAQRVTGLVVNDRPSVPRKDLRRLRAILHRARKEGLDQQNRAGRPNFREWLRGKIAYVSMVRPEVGRKLREQFEALCGSRQ